MPKHVRNVLSTQEVLDHIRAGKAAAITDGGGLTLTISATGYGAWVLRYRFQQRRREYTIGPVADYPLEQAREIATDLRRRVAEGEDISETKRLQKTPGDNSRAPGTFAALAETWFNRTRRGRLEHPQVVWRVFTNWIDPHLGMLRPEDIQDYQILDCLENIRASGAPTVVNDARRQIKHILEFGVALGVISAYPTHALEASQSRITEAARQRSLTLAEVNTLLRCMEEHRKTFGREKELAIRVLLLLGVRKRELIQARWSDISLSAPRWQLPRGAGPGSRSIIIPLPPMAVEHFAELETLAAGSEWVLPARRQGARKNGHLGQDTLNRALHKLPHGVDDFVVHDLRRTMRTNLGELAVRPEVAEKCLNHKLRGALAAFDPQDFLRERRAALQRWASVIETLDRDGLDAARESYRLSNVLGQQVIKQASNVPAT